MASDDSVAIEIDDFKDEFTGCATGECRVSVLPILFQISQIINDSEDLTSALTLILGVMEERMKIVRGMVSLYDRQSETIFVHASFGLTEEQKQRGIYSLGEGVTGKVVKSGKPVIVPHIGSDPGFLDRTRSREETAASNCTFFCVPIVHAKKVLGTISAERVYANRRLLRQDVELLATIASMVAPAVELYLLENVEKVRLENENRRLRSALKERFHPSNIIGNSKPMLAVYDLIEKVASTKATVLVLGESGVGKELVANAIHYNGASADGPFVKFNCAALPESIVESELFGHEKGSFTGAAGLRKGRFELADGGSIFLDEIGELSLAHAGQAAARAAGEDLRAGRRQPAGEGGPAHHRRDQPQPAGDGGEGSVPRGSLLPAARLSDHHPAAARARQRRDHRWPIISSPASHASPARRSTRSRRRR